MMKIKRLLLLLMLALIIVLSGCSEDTQPRPTDTGTPVATVAEARELLQSWLDKHSFSSPVTINDDLTTEDDTSFTFVLYQTEELTRIRAVKANGRLLWHNPQENSFISIDGWYNSHYKDGATTSAADPAKPTEGSNETPPPTTDSTPNPGSGESGAIGAGGSIGANSISGTFVNPNDRGMYITFTGKDFEIVDYNSMKRGSGTFTIKDDNLTLANEITMRLDRSSNSIWHGNIQYVSGIMGEETAVIASSEPTEHSKSLLRVREIEWITMTGMYFSIRVPGGNVDVVDIDQMGEPEVDKVLRERVLDSGLVAYGISAEGVKKILENEAASYEPFHFEDGNAGWVVEMKDGATQFINDDVTFVYNPDLDRYNIFFNNRELLDMVARTLTKRVER